MAFGRLHGVGHEDGDTFGKDTSAKISFYGVTPIAQRASSAQSTLTITTMSQGGYGFVTSGGFTALLAQVEEIRAALVAIGAIKGSS